MQEKKTGEIRMCVDYRALNEVTVKNKYPLPLIDDIIDNLSNKQFFTVLDFKNGFHHVPMAEGSRNLRLLLLRLDNTSILECHLDSKMLQVNLIFNDLIRARKIQIYIDDLIIATETVEQNFEILAEVLNTCSEKGLIIRLDKCIFFSEQIEYLGYDIKRNCISPSRNKIRAVPNFPESKSVHDVRSFLGLTGYFRRFVKDYARVAKPLSDLLRQNRDFKFNTSERETFNNLKSKLVTETILAIFNPNLNTQLHTDASSHGFGAILMQQNVEDNLYHPIYYYSVKTTEAESKYHSFELEALAIIKALAKFRVYLLGTEFRIFTDCSALKQTE